MRPELQPFLHKIFVVGGGARVRHQQLLHSHATDVEKDQIGMKILEEHADQLAEILKALGYSVAAIPRNVLELKALVPRIQDEAMVVSGLQPGQSTDTGAVYTAELFRKLCKNDAWVVILSNVLTIFTADPKKNAAARPIRKANVRKLVSEGVLLRGKDQWKPGMPVPIDPVAVDMLVNDPVKRLYFTNATNTPDVKKFLKAEPTENGTTLVAEEIETEYYE